LKEDLNESKIGNSTGVDLERNRKGYIQTLSKELIKVEKITPYYKEGELEMSEFKNKLQEEITDLLGKLLILEDPIQDVVNSNNYQSKFVKNEEFEMIKQWLPKGTSWNPRLIYQASKHGKDAGSFHKQCDGKANTITLIKAKFTSSSKTVTIGGFLDQKWHSNSAYIKSSKSFIFSTTAKKKCPVTTQQHAGYGIAGQGPTFGSGHDLAVWLNGTGTQCYVNPSGYQGTAQITENGNGGMQYFEALEVEVYSL